MRATSYRFKSGQRHQICGYAGTGRQLTLRMWGLVRKSSNLFARTKELVSEACRKLFKNTGLLQIGTRIPPKQKVVRVCRATWFDSKRVWFLEFGQFIGFTDIKTYYMQVSYNGYYLCLPRRWCGFDSHYLLQYAVVAEFGLLRHPAKVLKGFALP